MKTNYFFSLEQILSDKLISEAIFKLEKLILLSESNYYQKNYITNPILKIFYQSSKITSDTGIRFNMNNLLIDQDLFLFKFTAHLCHFLEAELAGNLDYKNEVTKAMLSFQGGVFYKVFHELVIGSYLKYLGYEISFNSSKQSGKPDVVAKGRSSFLNEAKLFDDQEFYLTEKINEMSPLVIDFLQKITNHEVILFISELSNNFETEFIKATRDYLVDGKDQKSENIWLMRTPSFYIGNEGYLVDYIPNNSRLRFKPNFNLSYSIEKLKRSIQKAERQFDGKEGIVWVTFPHPKEFPMEKVILLNVSDIPKELTLDRPEMAIYNFLPIVGSNSTELKVSLDLINTKEQFNAINQDSFHAFMREIFHSPVLLVE